MTLRACLIGLTIFGFRAVCLLLALAPDINVEFFDADILLGQSLAKGGQIIEQDCAGCGRFGFEMCSEGTLMHCDFDMQRTQFGRAESYSDLPVTLLCRTDGSTDSSNETYAVDGRRFF